MINQDKSTAQYSLIWKQNKPQNKQTFFCILVEENDRWLQLDECVSHLFDLNN